MMAYDTCELPGKYVIYSHKRYLATLQLAKRSNARDNVNRIQTTFDKLKFTRHGSHKDFAAEEIESDLCELIGSDFSRHGSLFVFILTHGHVNYQLAANDKFYYLEDLVTAALPNIHSTLRGKPIFFIIQACSGNEFDLGASTSANARPRNTRQYSNGGSLFMTAEPDLAFFFASTPGIISFRGLLVPTLCDVIDAYHDRFHIQYLFTLVRNEVAKEEKSYQNLNRIKQMPMLTSTLTKKFTITSR
ncbi:hypothetical protein CHUAL_007071 [Chamberlinius hualienensis]